MRVVFHLRFHEGLFGELKGKLRVETGKVAPLQRKKWPRYRERKVAPLQRKVAPLQRKTSSPATEKK
jgi:ribosomal protein S30